MGNSVLRSGPNAERRKERHRSQDLFSDRSGVLASAGRFVESCPSHRLARLTAVLPIPVDAPSLCGDKARRKPSEEQPQEMLLPNVSAELKIEFVAALLIVGLHRA